MTALRSLVFLLSLLILAQCALRFRDEELMKAHHNEPNPNAANLTFHLIPHSHDDVGWLKTVDNYFYGGDQRTQVAAVQFTIDTVVQQLVQHPEYKFSIVQVAFLYRWWNQATEKQRQQMKALVENKQLQFINGGWCMSDESNMYYEDFIDQMTVGLRWLKQKFNYVPDVAWHIDPFGHHASSASLFSKMGFQSFFFARIDYQDKEVRLANKTMEMIWRPTQYNPDPSTYIFTHVNYYHYSAPPGFCFDAVCLSVQPVKDDPTLQDYNIDKKAAQLVKYIQSQALHFRTNNLMHTLGEDFQFTNARWYFKNIDKLVKYINQRPQFGVNIIYSTPGEYIKAIQQEGATYPNKFDDFLPYADNQHSFWTGYYVSRTSLKGFIRDFNRFVQAARKHISELKISDASAIVRDGAKAIEEKIFGMEMALGILQHHDAVSGTAKQKVTDDYVATGLRSINDFIKLYKQIKSEEIQAQTGQKTIPSDLYFNIYWNQTAKVTGVSTAILANKTVFFSLYNPGTKYTRPIKIKVPNHELNVVSARNTAIPGDVICGNIADVNDCQLFITLDFEEGENTYIKLVPVKTGGSAKVVALKQLTITEQVHTFNLSADSLKLTRGNQKFDLTLNGTLNSFNVFYNYYESYNGTDQKSGAYIFRPQNDNPRLYSTMKKIHYADGNHVALVVVQADKTQTKLTFSKDKDWVRTYGFQIQTFVDSIPITDGWGKEVTLNFKSTFTNNKTFYTDSNGLEEQKRIIDYRPTWPYVVHQPTAGNYYPINSHIRIIDSASNKSLAIVADRSQGGTVMRDGQIQIMIQRRTLHDDSRGVGEPLNETDTDGKGLRQYVRHWVVFGDQFRSIQKWNDQKPLIVIAPTSTSTFSKVSPRFPPISVPSSVKLFLRPFEDNTYLLRLHNFDINQKVSFDLDSSWKITEYTLSANQLQSDWKAKQYKWKEEKSSSNLKQKLIEVMEDIEDVLVQRTDKIKKANHKQFIVKSPMATTITLQPFEIKTFRILKS